MSQLNLFQKIHKVMESINYLVKDSRIKFGSTDYKALSEEKVTTTVREKLVEHGLIIIPVEQSISRDGVITTVNTKYKIIDIVSGDSEILASSGQGADTQDKGAGKAMTYGYKYLLLRSFAIPTGEDTDKISSAEIDHKLKEKEKTKNEFSKKQKDMITEIKAIFSIENNNGLNKYVEFWSKKKGYKLTNYKELTVDNIQDFCDFIRENGHEVNPF